MPAFAGPPKLATNRQPHPAGLLICGGRSILTAGRILFWAW
jgi:hypothetical protein